MTVRVYEVGDVNMEGKHQTIHKVNRILSEDGYIFVYSNDAVNTFIIGHCIIKVSAD